MAKILFIVPYDFYPAQFGGALRCFHLLNEVSRTNEVTLLTVQPISDFKDNCTYGFPCNVAIESIAQEPEFDTIFNLLPLKLARGLNSRVLQRNLFKKGNLYLLKTYPLLKKLLLSNKFDVVIYESLECFSALSIHVRKLSPSTKQVYDAHNVDSDLWATQAKISMGKVGKTYSDEALKVERGLHKMTDLCYCCSEADKKKLQQLNDGRLNITVIPNGVDTQTKLFDLNQEKFIIENILFCGALDYGPNKEGLLWFCEKIFPLVLQKNPGITLTVIGKLNNKDPYLPLKEDPAINFIGPVDNVADYYYESSVAIVPLLTGSGTRLKILEAMSFGNPVVSTKIGAEGLEFSNGHELLIRNAPNDFATAIVNLIGNKCRFDQLRTNARNFVRRKYDWESIGRMLDTAICEL